MQVNDTPTVKRQRAENNCIPSSSLGLKRIKLEDEARIDEDLRTKSPTRGAEQVPYPVECRPSSQYYAWHRHQFILDMKRRFASQNKLVTNVRFLDDGVALDWVLDKSARRNLDDEVLQENLEELTKTPSLEDHSKATKSEDTSVVKEKEIKEEIPGLRFYNSGMTVDISEGTELHPILVSDSDMGCGTKVEIPDSAQVNGETKIPIIPGDPSPDTTFGYAKIACSQSISTVTKELIVSVDEQQDTARAEQSDLCGAVEARDANGSQLPVESPNTDKVDDGGFHVRQEMLMLRQRTRAVSESSSSSDSSMSSSKCSPRSEETAHQCALTARDYSVYEGYESLQELGWKHRRSILILKNLPHSSHANDIHRYLQLNSLATSELRDIRIHAGNSPEHKPIATVRFGDPSATAVAVRILMTASLPFFASLGGGTESALIQIEPYRPPSHWKDELWAESDSTASDGEDFVPGAKSMAIPGQKPSPNGEAENQRRKVPPSPPTNITTSSPGHSECSQKRELRSPGGATVFPSDSVSIATEHHTHQSTRPKSVSMDSGTPTRTTPDSDTYDSEGEYSSSGSSSAADSDHIMVSDDQLTSSAAVVEVHSDGADSASANRIKQIQLPTVKHGRARRLLRPPSRANPLMSVTMRGDVQFIDQNAKERIPSRSLPAKATDVHRLEDACLVNGFPVLGFSRSDHGQVSVVAFLDETRTKPTVVPLKGTPHTVRGILSLVPFNASANGLRSDSSLETTGTFQFLSGGYDKTVHLWHINSLAGNSGKSRFSSRASSVTKGQLNSKVSALLQLPGESRVLAGVGQRLWTLDAEHRVPQSAIHFSNLINQLHAPSKKNPSVFIAEVDHLYAQMQVHDLRTSRGKPVLEFGYADTAEARHARSHKRRGDSLGRFFVRGYQDSTVCLWDYRNVKEPVCLNKSGDPVTHAIFAGRESRDVWTYGGDKIKHIEMR